MIRAKILMQQLWIAQCQWDDKLPAAIFPVWREWTSQLSFITPHPVHRKYSDSDSPIVSSSLQGFSDTSKAAYGAAVYLRRVHKDDKITVSLVYAKAKVCPLKTRTIGQLELQAAYLLADLLVYVAKTLSLPLDSAKAWTDSTIVLHWIRRQPCTLKEFEANRVAHIQEALQDCSWRHVASADNPEDQASRGVSALELFNSDLWWHGPPWLARPENEWPHLVVGTLPRVLPGVRMVTLAADVEPVVPFTLWTDYSCYNRLKRTVAWLRRWIHNFRHRKAPDKKWTDVPLSCKELSAEHIFLLRKA